MSESDLPSPALIKLAAAGIHDGFRKYNDSYRRITRRARKRFEKREWNDARKDLADRIELYTGPFAATAWEHGLEHAQSQRSFERYRDAARFANSIGLGVNAGHDLDTENLKLFNQIECLLEVSIGHALINDALNHGLSSTVAAYLQALHRDE